MDFWIRFDNLWTDCLEAKSKDVGASHYWQSVYDAMEHVVDKLQILVGQDEFNRYLEESNENSKEE